MTVTKEKAAVPRLRFKGYEGEWAQQPIGELFSERDERSAEGELLSVTIRHGVVRACDSGKTDSSSADKSHYKVVKIRDLAYNSMRMWQGACGASKYDGIVSPAYTVIVPNAEADSEFFEYTFKRPKVLRQFQRNSQGMTSDTWNLKFPLLKDICISCPGRNKQVRIATAFRNFDKLILMEASRLTSLRQLKRAMLVKMFPRPGQCVPEIRFRGFDGKWEEKRLSLCMVSKDARQKPSALAPLMAFTSQGGVTEKGERYDRSSLIKNVNKLYKRTDYDDFIYSSNNLDVGSIGLNKYGSAVISDVYEVFECIRDVVDPDCLNEIIRQKESIKKILIYRQGCLYGQYRIYADDFLSVKILVPGCLDEQRKIGAFFRNLDKLIGAAEKKVAKLRQVKASLLERMFV